MSNGQGGLDLRLAWNAPPPLGVVIPDSGSVSRQRAKACLGPGPVRFAITATMARRRVGGPPERNPTSASMPEAGAEASAGKACAWQAQEHGGRQLCIPGFFTFHLSAMLHIPLSVP